MVFILSLALFLLFLYVRSISDRVTEIERSLNITEDSAPTKETRATQTMYPNGVFSQIDNDVQTVPRPIQSNGEPMMATELYENRENFIPPIPLADRDQQQVESGVDVFSWFREQTLIKIGSAIFFLGAIWFVGYAIEQNWISPIMRIVLGLLLACSVYVVGIWRSKTQVTQYQILTILGTGIFLGATIASQFAFPQPVVPAGFAFFLMLMSIGYTLYVALRTKTQWLAVTASIAGLCVPFLIKLDEPQSALMLMYVFLLSAGFLGVVLFTSWRNITFTLLLGSIMHLLVFGQSALLSDNILWLFVIGFSALFFASTTISITRTNTPTPIDISVLALSALQFIIYAVTIALLPAVGLFVAATVTAGIGYLLLMRNANPNAVSMYTAISLLLILVGTAELFDGFVLTIAYAVEALAVFLLTLKVALRRRYVYIAAALFLLPFSSGLNDFSSAVWNKGIVHPEALGTLSVIISLGLAVVWILRKPALFTIDWLRGTAVVMFTLWATFATVTCFQIGYALVRVVDTQFLTTTLLTLLALSVILYVLRTVQINSWRIWVLAMLLTPAISAMTLLSHSAWSDGVSHLVFVAALSFFAALVLLAIMYWQKSTQKTENVILRNVAYVFVWLIIGYGFMLLTTIWDALITGEANRVVTAISYIFLVYVVINTLMLVRTCASKIIPIIFVLIIPVLLLVESLDFSGWSDGLMGINAIGLYITTTIFILLGVTVSKYKHELHVPESDRPLLTNTSSALFIVAGLLIYALVWIMSLTTFASSGTGVVVALFIYTVSGLFAYTFGRMNGLSQWKRVGVILLTTVVLRLALVDVWVMETVWRIVTFLGIGLLFIITALLERSHEKTKSTDKNGEEK